MFKSPPSIYRTVVYVSNMLAGCAPFCTKYMAAFCEKEMAAFSRKVTARATLFFMIKVGAIIVG